MDETAVACLLFYWEQPATYLLCFELGKYSETEPMNLMSLMKEPKVALHLRELLFYKELYVSCKPRKSKHIQSLNHTIL